MDDNEVKDIMQLGEKRENIENTITSSATSLSDDIAQIMQCHDAHKLTACMEEYRKHMVEAARALQFEKAAVLRDKIKAIDERLRTM